MLLLLIKVLSPSKLGLDERRLYRRPRKKFVNHESGEVMAQNRRKRNIVALRRLFEKYTEVSNSFDMELATSRNKRTRLEQKIQDVLRSIPAEDLQNCFATANIHEIIQEIQTSGIREEYIQWITNWVADHSTNYSAQSNIQEEYAEDPSKTIKNRVMNSVQPQCQVRISDLHDLHAANFAKPIIPYEPLQTWKLRRKLTQDLQEDLDKIFAEEKLTEMIRSRKASSSTGADGISYAVFKDGGKEAVTFIKELFQSFWHFNRVPGTWNTTIVKMLYKKGDPTAAANWRPISLTSAVYRMFTCMLSRTISEWHSQYGLFNQSQNGFVPHGNTYTNSALVQEILNDAERNNHSVILTTLDFKNAFGSTPHSLILDTMRQKGVPEKLIDMVRSLYKNATVCIETESERDQPIQIEVGTRQGCPLSPTLFNFCLEPLLEKLSARDDIGYKLGDDRINTLAYADDIILIAHDVKGMETLLHIAEDFCRFSRMQLVPHKCCTYSYMYDETRRRTSLSEPLKINNVEVPLTHLQGTIKYLGVDITMRHSDRMKATVEHVTKLTETITALSSSKLPISQKLHAYNTVIVPELEFQTMYGQCKAHDIRKIDQKMRGSVNKMVGGTIPVAVQHSPIRDGGLGIKRMEDALRLAPIKASLRMLLNHCPRTQRIAQYCLNSEAKKRHATIGEQGTGYFFNWTDSRKGTNSIFGRAYKQCKKLNLRIERTKEGIQITDLLTEEEFTSIDPSSLCYHLTKMIMKRTSTECHQETFHLHQMKTFANCKPASSFIQEYKAPKADSFVKFAVCARVNALMNYIWLRGFSRA